MNEIIKKGVHRIYGLNKEAIDLEQEYECAKNFATRYLHGFEATGDENERTNAIKWSGKAWKTSRKIASIKESIRSEASVLAQMHRTIHEAAKPDSEEAYASARTAKYFNEMKEKASRERKAYIERSKKALESIKALESRVLA